MKTITQTYDLVVAGGGLSGVCAALAAARHGIRTVLIQDRPMLGGNASSEFRMHICGADRHGSRPNLRETGILEELLLSVKQQNPNPNFWALDTVLWEACQREAKHTLLLNTHVTGAQVEGSRISAISAIQLASDRGYMKRCLLIDYDRQARGGKGVKTFSFVKNGVNGTQIAAALAVREPFDFVVRQKNGTETVFNTEAVPIETKAGKGEMFAMVVMDDCVEEIYPQS